MRVATHHLSSSEDRRFSGTGPAIHSAEAPNCALSPESVAGSPYPGTWNQARELFDSR